MKKETEKIECKYCGADILPEQEEKCLKNPTYWNEWWKGFHKQLDLAVASMINEKSKGPHIFLPSQHSIMELLQYSFEKQKTGEE